MKTYLIALLVAVTVLITSCVVTDSSKDEYFGYYSKPRAKEVVVVKERVVEKQQPTKKEWKNPLKDSGSDEYNASGDNTGVTEYYDNDTYTQRTVYSTRYVPVIVPWWDRYYYDYYYYEPGFRISYYSGGWWGCDWNWYSPYYDYHPYWGNRWHGYGYYPHWWSDPYYYQPHYYNHDNQHYATGGRSVRTFGPYRGKTSINNTNNPASTTLFSSPRSSYIPEKTGSSSAIQSARGNRSTYLPAASSNRSDFKSAAPNTGRSNSRSTFQAPSSSRSERSGYQAPAGNSNRGSSERSRYTPSENSSGSSSSSTRSSGSSSSGSSNSSGGGSSRSTYSPPSGGSSSSGSSGRSSGGSSGGGSKSSGGSRSTK